jgi:cellobiose-specific phosphotransferase system component IIA
VLDAIDAVRKGDVKLARALLQEAQQDIEDIVSIF